MKMNSCLPNARTLIALALAALVLTSAGANPSKPDVAKPPPANLKLDQVDMPRAAKTPPGSLKLDQVDSVTGTKRTLTPGKIEYPNARTKAGDAAYWELGEDGAKAPRAKTAKAASGDEAGTIKGMRSNRAPRPANAASGNSGSLPAQKANAQYNPKELSVDKRK